MVGPQVIIQTWETKWFGGPPAPEPPSVFMKCRRFQAETLRISAATDAPVAAGERTKNQIFWAHVFQD
jgi:hypothetical protein